MTPFSMGESIILEEVRYISDDGGYFLFHSNTFKNNGQTITKSYTCNDYTDRYKAYLKQKGFVVLEEKAMPSRTVKRKGGKKETIFPYRLIVVYTPPFITKDCSKMDETGFCSGHKMKREDFINEYCGGSVPPQVEDFEE